jgi:hypothetical protein
MSTSFVLGLPKYQTRTKKQMTNAYAPLNVGDIVAIWKFYRNGKPIKPDKFNYRDPAISTIGIVIAERQSDLWGKPIIIVKWTNTKNLIADGVYLKETSGSYLLKLS